MEPRELQDEKSEAELARRKPFNFICIGTEWKGGKESLNYLREIPNLRGLLFAHDDVSDDWISIIADLPQLERLYFSSRKVTDKTMVAVGKLTKLRAEFDKYEHYLC